MRQAVAALLMAILALAGAMQGAAAAREAGTFVPPIPGVAAPICHSGHPGGPIPGDPASASHDCCDQCALCAPVLCPEAPQFPAVARIGHDVVRSALTVGSARLSRARTPRQSQGPPDRVT